MIKFNIENITHKKIGLGFGIDVGKGEKKKTDYSKLLINLKKINFNYSIDIFIPNIIYKVEEASVNSIKFKCMTNKNIMLNIKKTSNKIKQKQQHYLCLKSLDKPDYIKNIKELLLSEILILKDIKYLTVFPISRFYFCKVKKLIINSRNIFKTNTIKERFIHLNKLNSISDKINKQYCLYFKKQIVNKINYISYLFIENQFQAVNLLKKGIFLSCLKIPIKRVYCLVFPSNYIENDNPIKDQYLFSIKTRTINYYRKLPKNKMSNVNLIKLNNLNYIDSLKSQSILIFYRQQIYTNNSYNQTIQTKNSLFNYKSINSSNANKIIYFPKLNTNLKINDILDVSWIIKHFENQNDIIDFEIIRKIKKNKSQLSKQNTTSIQINLLTCIKYNTLKKPNFKHFIAHLKELHNSIQKMIKINSLNNYTIEISLM